MNKTAEHQRLEDHSHQKANWKKWGPYLSERAWGTVREDYSREGNAWKYFPHEHAHLKAYRWGEDGLGGISDRNQYLCFSVALWNGNDAILKERLFGLDGIQGNHGEDVKEYYFYLDNTPTHSYMKMLYKYPQDAFPYTKLIEENSKRGFHDPEYELFDTGVFEGDRYFDIFIEYAKAAEEDILIQITIHNRGPFPATCHVLPTLWFRKTWGWGYEDGPMGDVEEKPNMQEVNGPKNASTVKAHHPVEGTYFLYAEGCPELIFTHNESNIFKLYNLPNQHLYVKDAFHSYLIHNKTEAINSARNGTKMAAIYHETLDPGHQKTIRLRLTKENNPKPFHNFKLIFQDKIKEADEYYASIQNQEVSDEERHIQRQSFAGMLWSKQLYYYDIEQWLRGDDAYPPPPEDRKKGRNSQWEHLTNFDVISMPDKWEYPWYASWDLAFHCLPLVLLDPDFAKRQLTLMTREWYIHPNGQFPACEWEFSDVNPPVHAWAAWRVYKIDAKNQGKPDREFLKSIFHKLLLNFTWWVNRKDIDGRNVFQGGFLGLDNISLFDRSKPLPIGGYIDQSDGTAWMAFYSLMMMKISLELAIDDPVYQDTATKFFEHFLRIAGAMSNDNLNGPSLWHQDDGFFYDALHLPDGSVIPLKVRSLVGLLPLLAVETLEPDVMKQMPIFSRRVDWFINKRPQTASRISCTYTPGLEERRLMAILTPEQLISTLKYMLDEKEFLSPYGIRSLSKYHQHHPFVLLVGQESYQIDYQPGESSSYLFGGNSNWRGPIWFPINFLLIESLQKFYHYYGDDLKVEFPNGSGQFMNLWEVSTELSKRLINLFIRDTHGHRPIYGRNAKFQYDPHWKDLILFHEYFHGDHGKGLGASHQTGWTGLVAKLIQQSGSL